MSGRVGRRKLVGKAHLGVTGGIVKAGDHDRGLRVGFEVSGNGVGDLQGEGQNGISRNRNWNAVSIAYLLALLLLKPTSGIDKGLALSLELLLEEILANDRNVEGSKILSSRFRLAVPSRR